MPVDAVELRALSVSYDETVALSDVNLAVAPGEMLALLGPSGSGKSTLLHTVAGFNTPRAGEIWLTGRRVASSDGGEPPERRGVAMVFQNYALWPHLTALDTVAYPMRRRGMRRRPARHAAGAILDQLQIGHLADRRPAQLSGGEQQRVGLGRALAGDPAIYLFDEPTAHLDTHVRGVFLEELVTRLRNTGAATLYATHDPEEALGLADRVALLMAGRVIQVGTPEAVYRRPVNVWAARLTGPVSVLTDARGPLLVRPEWASLDGDRAASIDDVRFRGPHSDYHLETGAGELLIRAPGPPRHVRGDRVTWTLQQSWLLPEQDRPVQPSSNAAGAASPPE